MKISTKGRYALEALLYMACTVKNEPVNIREIAGHTNISEKYLEQLFFQLRKTGIIDTVRGPKGGYFIAKDCESVLAGDVIRAVEGDIVPVPCVKDIKQCNSELADICVTRMLWRNISQAIDSVLDSVNLAGLAEDFKRQTKGKYLRTEFFI